MILKIPRELSAGLLLGKDLSAQQENLRTGGEDAATKVKSQLARDNNMARRLVSAVVVMIPPRGLGLNRLAEASDLLASSVSALGLAHPECPAR